LQRQVIAAFKALRRRVPANDANERLPVWVTARHPELLFG